MAVFLYLLIYVLAGNYVVGVPQLNLTGPDHAVINHPHTFMCYITPSTDVTNPVAFYKETTTVCTILSPCRVVNVVTGYACECKADSGNSKVYKLTILNTTLTDERKWSCVHGVEDRSNIFQLPVYSVQMDISGASNAVLGESYTLFFSVSPAASISYNVIFTQMRRSVFSSVCTVRSSCVERFSNPGYNCGCYSESGGVRVYNLTIQRAAPIDDTQWRCQYSTDFSSTFSLQVFYGPSQIKVISNEDAVEGRLLTLTCSTMSAVKPDVEFTWKFQDGSHVTGTKGDKQGSSGNTWSQTMTLTPSKALNRQIIKCSVKNTATQTESTGQKNMDVKYSPSAAPVITGTTFPVFENKTVTLRCSTTGGKPKPSLTLSCTDVSVSQSCSDREETRTCTISFTANRMQNNKNCVCTPAWQYGGYTQNQTINMSIYYPPDTPSLTSDPTQPWLEHRSGTLRCSLPSSSHGNPAATFYWVRNNVDIQHRGPVYSLTASKEDNEDWYTCTAGNLFTERPGESRPASSSLQLNVYYAPRVKISPGNHTRVELGKLLILTCSADSNADNVSFEWTLGTRKLVNGPDFQIPAFRESDQGKYTCSATTFSTTYGSLTRSTSVIATVLEPAALSCYCTDQSSDSVDLVWETSDRSTRFTIAQRQWNMKHWVAVSVLDVERAGNTFTLHVPVLKSNFSYYFKIFSSLNKDDSSFCLTVCRTLALPNDTAGLGLGSGLAIGVVLGMVVAGLTAVIIITILMRKGYRIRSDAEPPKETSVYQDITMDTIQQASPRTEVSGNTNESSNAYESLQSQEATAYEKLKSYSSTSETGMYENTGCV